jgi:hypothetical protein
MKGKAEVIGVNSSFNHLFKQKGDVEISLIHHNTYSVTFQNEKYLAQINKFIILNNFLECELIISDKNSVAGKIGLKISNLS